MEQYEHTKIESKWQKYWQENKSNVIDLDNAKKPFYNLMMFPYPSAEGLHIGNMYTFTGVDTYGRYQRMKGYDVFEPIGLDAFGIHSENYALKIGEHINKVSVRSEKHFYEQLHMAGNMFDWEKSLETNKPEYYKWTQWLFIQFFKAGLAYRKKAYVKYCPSCKTVLSDEQVIDDHCERCGTLVENRDLVQWFFRITKYAEKLNNNLEKIDWDNEVKLGQKNWIGKKTGINIDYKIDGSDKSIICFTTRPDTNFGATFIVLAPEHEFVTGIIEGLISVEDGIKDQVKEYVEKATSKSDIERISEGKKKTGVFTGFYGINSLNDKKLPIYVSDFVLGNFGTGAVVGVPGHDVRDYEFAKAFDLEIIRVVTGEKGEIDEIDDISKVQEKTGTMMNSDFLNGLNIHDAVEKMMDYLEEKGYGKRVKTYNLRDWCVSRQRYWGPPIPMIFCQNCHDKGLSWFNTTKNGEKDIDVEDKSELFEEMKGWYPDENLPVKLPEIADLKDIIPDGSGRGPLSLQKDFVKTECPHCKSEAVRETDVSDPFVDSCWYFLRYPFTEFANIPFGGKFDGEKSFFKPEIDPSEMEMAIKRMKKWGPVTSYIGGKEHTVLHLLYARFITMVFNDLGYLDFEEPFTKFVGHGLITKDGAKMSKSKGNIINPDEYIGRFGVDSIRMYLRFLGPFDQGGDWRDDGMQGMYKFVNKVWGFYQEIDSSVLKNANDEDLLIKSDTILHKTIKKVGEDLENLKFNTVIACFMQFFNWYQENKTKLDEVMKSFYLKELALLMAPFMPHLTEEFWLKTGGEGSVHNQKWPKYIESKLIDDLISLPVQVNGKVRGTIEISRDLPQSEIESKAKQQENVAKHIEGMTIIKVIYIKDKIINILVK